MSLKLPNWLRRRINAIIARRLRARHLVGGAFALGLTVSLLEFVCTGQVYLPLIRYMTAAAETRLRGLALLALYDAAFVTPLVVVFGAVYFGVRSESLAAGFRRHAVAGKVALGLFFVALAALLTHAEFAGL
jgi:cytochrome c biogenesis protein CcdA